MKSGRPPVPAIGVAVQVVEEGADEVLHAVAGGVVEGRVVRVVLSVSSYDGTGVSYKGTNMKQLAFIAQLP